MTDKRMSAADVVAQLRSGMTIGIGGWGSRRKPMALVREILRSDVDDLTVVTFGGPDIGLLCAAGKVKRAVYAFVADDVASDTNRHSPVLEPHFRKARQAGTIEDEPYDEGMVLLGLQAAAWRVPFLPTRVGLGSDLFRDNPRLKTVRSPYEDGEELVAMPALRLDAALVHMNRADQRGNAVYLGPDPYFDDLMLMAADRGYVSCERVVETAQLTKEAPLQALRVNRAFVHGVVEAPGGAAFTSCEPDYDRDEALHGRYMASARSDDAWQAFVDEWVEGGK
ncbi:MAG TPA: CoA-transferase [Acidimicrobiales bacterium]|nr:CoA-transferase [Acidimicrobiales bacterium]